MADKIPNEEPSMEEILASIRRIISEDGAEERKPPDTRAAEKSPATQARRVADEAAAGTLAEVAEEVLELTDEVDDQGNVVAASEPEAKSPDEEELPVEMSDPQSEEAAVSVPSQPAEPLMEVSSKEAAAGAFAALESQVGFGLAEQSAQRITPGGRTIEDHVLEMLRPMLREWLDEHLPQMVQRLVQREIDRIIHRSDPV